MIHIIQADNTYENLERIHPQYSLQLIDCLKYTYDGESLRRFKSLQCHTLIICEHGELSIENSASDIFFIPKFSKATLKFDSCTDFFQIRFDAELALPLFKQHTVCGFSSTAEFHRQVKKLYQASYTANSIPGIGEAILLCLLNDLNYSHISSPQHKLYNKTCLWIENNAQKAISAQDAADALKYSRAHLNRVFKAVSDESLSEKISEFRITEIKNLCHIKELSVCDIAKKLDFGSSELMCKFFKYHTGISITEYRNALY